MANEVSIPRLSLRPKEAAEALGIGTRLLWELTNRGEIACVRVGRAILYPVPVLEAWLRERARALPAGATKEIRESA